MEDSIRRFVLLKLTTDRHEASRDLFATAELLVLYGLEACPLRKTDLNSLDFAVNILFMKFFQTINMDIIKSCQSYFSFQLPSAVLSKRVAKINMKWNLRSPHFKSDNGEIWHKGAGPELPAHTKLCKNCLSGYTSFGQIYTKNYQFRRFWGL